MDLNTAQIKEIAEEIDCGLTCHWNPKTNELVFMPEKDAYGYEKEMWEDELQKLKKGKGDFKVIRPRSGHDFEIMKHFVNTLPTDRTKSALEDILESRNPFREFKHAVDHSAYRENWFEFRNTAMQEWVRNQVDMILNR